MKYSKFLILLLIYSSLFAEDNTVIELKNFRYRNFACKKFALEKDVTVKIECLGISDRWRDNMIAYGWILDLDTRKVVWRMDVNNSKKYKIRNERIYKNEVNLTEGNYELNYGVSPGGYWNHEYRDFGDFLRDLFNGFRDDKWRRRAGNWGVILKAANSEITYFNVEDFSFDEKSILSLAPVGDSEFRKEGFSLKKEFSLRIYAIGEGEDGEMYDYGWIVNSSTGERIWSMDYYKTGWAGGAEKNRIFDKNIFFPKGNYLVYYVTDASHSYEEWNRFPPFDPHHWGITLWNADENVEIDQVVELFNEDENQYVIVDLTRAGNNVFKEQGFTLTKSAELRVRCLGEYGNNGRFVDSGRIINAKTREVIWEMTRRNTEYAGGGKKNRMFNGVISFKPGSYKVFYKSDDSHSYRRWNVGPPYYPEAWGIKIFSTDKNFSSEYVKKYNENLDTDVLVSIIRVGNREHIKKKFTIDKATDVRIYALGELDDDDLHDYGWITDKEGNRIWSMDYWDSQPAGGASKNRMINEVIHLKAGDYTVYYRTDGSHSFNNWNDSPPNDMNQWGITIYKEKE